MFCIAWIGETYTTNQRLTCRLNTVTEKVTQGLTKWAITFMGHGRSG